MPDNDIKTGGGAVVEGDVKAGGDMTGRDRRREQNARSDPSQNMTYNAPSGENISLWIKVLELANQIQQLTQQMDNLPNRVERLERTEVIVKPGPEVLIRQVVAPEVTGIVLSAKALLFILMISFIVIVLLVSGLIYMGMH